jgi:hypothetical protein
MTIGDDAQAAITCPRCLYRLANPFNAAGLTQSPIRPDSLDRDVDGDRHAAKMLIVLICTVICVGLVILVSDSISTLAAVVAPILFICGGVYLVERAGRQSQPKAGIVEATAISPPIVRAIPVQSTGVLDYAGPDRPGDSWQKNPGCTVAIVAVLAVGLIALLILGWCGMQLSGLK